jgi:hypothetical protein
VDYEGIYGLSIGIFMADQCKFIENGVGLRERCCLSHGQPWCWQPCGIGNITERIKHGDTGTSIWKRRSRQN